MTQITIAALSDVTWRYSQFTTFTSHRLMLDWVHIWSCYYNNCILGRSHPEQGSQLWRKQDGVNNTQLNTFTCVHFLGISIIHKALRCFLIMVKCELCLIKDIKWLTSFCSDFTLSNDIGTAVSSSFTSMSSAIILTTSRVSADGGWLITLHKPCSSLSKAVQFCKTPHLLKCVLSHDKKHKTDLLKLLGYLLGKFSPLQLPESKQW